MNEKEIEKCRRQLNSQAPVIGGWRRSRALNKLRQKAAEGLLSRLKGTEEELREEIGTDLLEFRELALRCSDDVPQDWNFPWRKGSCGTSYVKCLAISPNSRILASGHGEPDRTGKDNRSVKLWSVRLWSLPDGKLLQILRRDSDAVNCLAFSPDGRILADDLSNESRKWLEFMVALMKWHHGIFDLSKWEVIDFRSEQERRMEEEVQAEASRSLGPEVDQLVAENPSSSWRQGAFS